MDFIAGVTPIPATGKIIGDEEKKLAHQAVDEGWLTEGHFTYEFEKALQDRFMRRHAIMVNSGSSALLLAIAALEIPKGNEVITCACAFPTTVNPIVQNGLIPVFVDCEPGTWNMDVSKLDEALSDKTCAVVVCSTLGNPADEETIRNFCWKHGLWMVSDVCDAMGATRNGQEVGALSEFSTYSFYPAHQITCGEGGALLTDNPQLAKVATSYRDWGRDCWCPPGKDNTCGKRFDGDYDHKHVFSRIGYNLKSTDLQAAIVLAQLKKLDSFVQKRRDNWNYLWENLQDLQGFEIELSNPSPNSEPSWFGFAFGTENRNELARYLDSHKIGNRPMFGGNIIRQPAYKSVKYRVVGDLTNADYVHEHLIYVGCWQGLTKEMLDYTAEVIHNFYE
jgi:CDP-6-deoxy-D-xylo-4-hexulose-3-dehydrase